MILLLVGKGISVVHAREALETRRISQHVVESVDPHERIPKEIVRAVIVAEPTLRVAMVSVNIKQYRKALRRLVKDAGGLEDPQSFETLDAAVAWLAVNEANPAINDEPFPAVPSAALLYVVRSEGRLILGEGALNQADKITPDQFAFVRASARALRDYAAKDAQIGDPRIFFQRYAIEYAPTDPKLRMSYVVRDQNDREIKYSSHNGHHLKDPQKRGWFNNRAEVARIYFRAEKIEERECVLILYCGPHPADDPVKCCFKLS